MQWTIEPQLHNTLKSLHGMNVIHSYQGYFITLTFIYCIYSPHYCTICMFLCHLVLFLPAEGGVQEGAGKSRAGDQENHSDHS